MAKHAMTEMEFFSAFDLKPLNAAINPTLEAWARDGGKFGEIQEWAHREFHVYSDAHGYHHVGETTTFTSALKLLIKTIEKEMAE